MRVIDLKAQGYRNLKEISLSPCEGVNIIHGDNAQGKTNLLESLWLFTGCKSFRGAKDSELIGFNGDFSRSEINFFGYGREQSAEMIIGEKKKIHLNGVELSSASKLAGNFLAVVFSPVHLSLVKEGPSERRKFLDIALCQLKPRYANALIQYNHTLAQRNSLLKDITYHSELYDTLEIWEERLAVLGAEIISARLEYTEKLKDTAGEIYQGISSGKETMKIEYLSSCESKDRENIHTELAEKLKLSRKEDIQNGSTSKGPHREDLDITVNEISARAYGSQGQQRSCALSLKLGEATLMKNLTGEQPVALLDDVMSELDSSRQDFILNHIDGWQVFITCCEPTQVLKLKSGKAFEVKNGEII